MLLYCTLNCDIYRIRYLSITMFYDKMIYKNGKIVSKVTTDDKFRFLCRSTSIFK